MSPVYELGPLAEVVSEAFYERGPLAEAFSDPLVQSTGTFTFEPFTWDAGATVTIVPRIGDESREFAETLTSFGWTTTLTNRATTDVVVVPSSGVLTLTGLDPGAHYWGVGLRHGQLKYVSFTTVPLPESGGITIAVGKSAATASGTTATPVVGSISVGRAAATAVGTSVVTVASSKIVAGTASTTAAGTAVTPNVAAATYADVVLADNPIVYYRLEETSGTNADDASSNGRDGTFSGTYTLNQSGKVGQAVRFNPGPLSAPVSSVWQLNDNFSLECWVKILTEPAASTFPGLLRFSSPSLGWAVFYNSQRRVQFRRATTSWQTSGVDAGLPAVTSNVWTHVVVTYDEASTTVKLYFNGAVITSWTNTAASWSPSSSTAAMTVGLGDTAGIGDHAIDEVAIYDTALSAARVLAHYNAA